MGKNLGAKLDLVENQPFILTPNYEGKLYILYVSAHILKLVRNAWAHTNVIIHSKGQHIQRKCICKILNVEWIEGLQLWTN